MTAMNSFCRRTVLLLVTYGQTGKTNNTKEEDKHVAETQMRRNDCSELFLHARWLVTERKKEKEQETNRTNKRGGKKRRNDCNGAEGEGAECPSALKEGEATCVKSVHYRVSLFNFERLRCLKLPACEDS